MKLATRRRAVPALALTAAIAAGASACGTTATSAATGSAAATSTAPGSAAATTAGGPGSRLTTTSGATVTVPGGKPTALVFITIGCADCAVAAQAAAQAQHSVGGKATLLGVDLDQGVQPSDVTGFLSQVGAPGLPVTINPALATTYQISDLSTVIVLNPAGHITYRAVAPSAQAIEAALAKAGA